MSHCHVGGCNYHEAECSGACAKQLPQGREPQASHDSITAATWCAMGMLAVLLVGAAAGLGMLLVDFVLWHMPQFFVLPELNP
jgi:hypothetical protein